ncbi:phenylacetate-CoA oxygenase subunit PaaC [Aquibium sp. A9E412]|uniref:1,2-phenylacetyl-CoA epoxidase subunit PaaC n=1 Tax=Aquibium sp. A9E412 TaxID=2976767 RepID=UPI0025AFA920|nr:1,2-phenylacetyl-CoA epoxidase subunit PaaC [Aquibium sp. A9E412]MDN2566583.1 phenylacetate-CoA oxygenase subunit PaaC [Aquibium sp. A9E412]
MEAAPATLDRATLTAFVLRLADDHLVLGHRLSEWCGHAPTLEEDLALPNMALDLIGQARALYSHAGALEGRGRDEDALAYLRPERDYVNCLMVERPNGDFAHTMLRQLYFAAFMEPMWRGMGASADATLKGIADKAVKEVAYHIRHAGEWVVRLGDGTAESARRMAEAAEALAPYVDELFETDAVTRAVAAAGVAPEPASLRADFDATVARIFAEARLERPQARWAQTGGRAGRHGEAMGFLLAELQHMQRSYPGATW